MLDKKLLWLAVHPLFCITSISSRQSSKKSCWFHLDLSFESYSLNVSNFSYSTKYLYIHYDLLLQQHFSLHPMPFYAHFYDLQNTNIYLALIPQILQSQYQLFNLSFYQPLVCLNYYNILTKLNNYWSQTFLYRC